MSKVEVTNPPMTTVASGRWTSAPAWSRPIPDEAMIALEDPDDRDGDGISGRAVRIKDVATGLMRVGRFGWKAQQATLLAFAGDAYRNEMGITNDLFRDEFALGIEPSQR